MVILSLLACLACKRLQIDTDMLPIITSTSDKLLTFTFKYDVHAFDRRTESDMIFHSSALSQFLRSVCIVYFPTTGVVQLC